MMAIPKNIHAGHRNRLRTRFLENGLESFQEHQVLELLLFYAIPRKDTNAISHVLLQRFGSMPKALQASREELKECQISDNAATFLHLMHVACERYYQRKYQKAKPTEHLFSFDTIAKYINQYFHGVRQEQFLLLLPDPKGNCQFSKIIHEGPITDDAGFIRSMVHMAVSHQAAGIILIHHLEENSEPSQEDLNFSYLLKESCQLIGIPLIDYILCNRSTMLSALSPDTEEDEDTV